MALLSLTHTDSGTALSLDEKDVVRMYEVNSQNIIEIVSGENSVRKTLKVDESASSVATASTILFSTTLNGGTIYLNSNRVMSIIETNSLAQVSYDAAGDKPEVLKLDVDQSTFEAALPSGPAIGDFLPLAGGTMTGDIEMSDNNITAGNNIIDFDSTYFLLDTDNGNYTYAYTYLNASSAILGYAANALQADANNIRLTVGVNHIIDIDTSTDNIKLAHVPGYASDSAAGTGGLVAGELWKTDSHATLPDGVLMVKA